jgi:hypothetical protein
VDLLRAQITFASSRGGEAGLLFPIAALLVTLALPDGRHAAPTFEFRPFSEGHSKKEELAACEKLLGQFPALGGDNSVRRLISLLPSV